MKKLKLYQFVDELPDMKYGSYVRWINISNDRYGYGYGYEKIIECFG